MNMQVKRLTFVGVDVAEHVDGVARRVSEEGNREAPSYISVRPVRRDRSNRHHEKHTLYFLQTFYLHPVMFGNIKVKVDSLTKHLFDPFSSACLTSLTRVNKSKLKFQICKKSIINK